MGTGNGAATRFTAESEALHQLGAGGAGGACGRAARPAGSDLLVETGGDLPPVGKVDRTLASTCARYSAGQQNFCWIGAAAFGGIAGQLRAFSSGGANFLAGDVNGDGVADFVIKTNVLLVQSDIVFA